MGPELERTSNSAHCDEGRAAMGYFGRAPHFGHLPGDAAVNNTTRLADRKS